MSSRSSIATTSRPSTTTTSRPSTALSSQPPAAASSRPSRFSPARWVHAGGLSTLVLALPMLLIFALFSWWPILRGLIMSVQKTNFITTSFVGLDNFSRVFADPLLAQCTVNTLYFAALALVFGFPVPILVATVLAEMRRTRRISSVFVFIPVVIPPVVSILLWKFFLNPGPDGLFNTVLGFFGIGPVQWLQNAATAMPSIVLEATWAGFGSTTIIYLAALAGMRSELYEAAQMDGASIPRRFWHITLPQLRGTMLVMFLLQIIGTFQVFTEPFLLTGGGPVNKTMTILMLIYNYAFVRGDYGGATALSVLLAVVLAVLSAIYLRLTRAWSTS